MSRSMKASVPLILGGKGERMVLYLSIPVTAWPTRVAGLHGMRRHLEHILRQEREGEEDGEGYP